MPGRHAAAARRAALLDSCYMIVYPIVYITEAGTPMRFVSVRELRGQSAAVWKALAKEKDLIVTSNGKPIALLSATSDESLEESLSALRRARAQAAATAMQQASVKAGTDQLSLQDINAEIDATRSQRTR